MNDCNFIGRLTKDPEQKTTQSGKIYTRFVLAVDRPKDKDGNKGADFIDCIAWNKTAETIVKYLSKGSRIGINGRLSTTTYEKNGEKRKSVDILVNSLDFLDSKTESKPQEVAPESPKDQIIIEDTAEDSGSLPFEV